MASKKSTIFDFSPKLKGPTIQEFKPDKAIDLWFDKCQRRPRTSGSQENKQDVDGTTAGLRVVDETDKKIEQDEEYVEHMPNYNHGSWPGCYV